MVAKAGEELRAAGVGEAIGTLLADGGYWSAPQIATPEGKALYGRRQQIVEPVFANTKFIRGADRFQRRGLAACSAAARKGCQPSTRSPHPPGAAA